MQVNHIANTIAQLIAANATLEAVIADLHPKIQAEIVTMRAVGRPEVAMSFADIAKQMGDVKNLVLTQAGYITRIKLAIQQSETNTALAEDLAKYHHDMGVAVDQWRAVDVKHSALTKDVETCMNAAILYYKSR